MITNHEAKALQKYMKFNFNKKVGFHVQGKAGTPEYENMVFYEIKEKPVYDYTCYNPECKGQGRFESEVGNDCPVCGERLGTNFYYTDGGSEPDGVGEYCFYDSKNDKYIYNKTEKHISNNEAEYSAMLLCMQQAEPKSNIKIDSQLVCYQIMGTYKVKAEHLRPYRDECYRLLIKKELVVEWIPRERNIAGKFLEEKK